MFPRGPLSSQALGQGCSRCLSSKKAPQCFCQGIASVICGHGMGARNARCNILHMSWAPFQLATDLGAAFSELSLFSVPILSHFCESLHDSLSPDSGCVVKVQVGAGGSPYPLSQVLFMQAVLKAPRVPWCLHRQNFPFIPVSASQLQFSAMLFRA